MPQLFNKGTLDAGGNVLREASPYLYGDGKTFLDAFVGRNIRKEDETGSVTINPLSGDLQIQTPRGLGLNVSPRGKSIEGSFSFGGPDTSIVSREPSQALDEALGVNPEIQYGPEPMSAGRRYMEQEVGNYLEGNPYGYR